MSNIIYVVMCEGGEYEDKFSYMLHTWSTHQAAEHHVIDLYFEQARKKYAHDRQEEFKSKWYDDNPMSIECPRQPSYPKWTGLRNDQITTEMRAHREAILAAHRQECELYGGLQQEREQRCRTACNGYLESIGLSLDMLAMLNNESGYFMYSNNECDYPIKEVEFD